MNSLTVVGTIFLLSLLGAVVLFRFFKSSAMIKRSTYQAGGAVAGFIVIYGLLTGSYYQIDQRNSSQLKNEIDELNRKLAIQVVSGVVEPDRQPLKVRLVFDAVEPDSGGRFSFQVPGVLLESPTAALYAVTDEQHAMLDESCAEEPCQVPESSLYLFDTPRDRIRIPVRLARK